MDAVAADRPDRRRRPARRRGPARRARRATPTRRRCSRSSAPAAPPTPARSTISTGSPSVAHERDLWFHVDGAYGLAALAAPSVRDRFRGVEHADSFVVDPHKWLFAPFDCAALLYRDPELARLAHTQHAAYLDPIEDRRRVEPVRLRLPPDPPGPRPPVLVLARGARHRRVHGRDRADAGRSRATRPRSIDAAPHVELVRQPELDGGAVAPAGLDARPTTPPGPHQLLAEERRVHHADDLAGRDRRPRGVPQPDLPTERHRRRHRLDGLTALRRSRDRAQRGPIDLAAELKSGAFRRWHDCRPGPQDRERERWWTGTSSAGSSSPAAPIP